MQLAPLQHGVERRVVLIGASAVLAPFKKLRAGFKRQGSEPGRRRVSEEVLK